MNRPTGPGDDDGVSLSARKEKLIGRLRNSRMRPREAQVLVEGPRVASEVLDAGIDLRFAVVSDGFGRGERGRGLLARLEEAGTPVEIVTDEELEALSDTESPQGVLLVCDEPAWSLETIPEEAEGRYLLLDRVQDPGNLGTLVRAGRAFAVDAVVALDGTVDPWNPKAVRAAAGASFHVPVLKEGWEGVRVWCAEGGVALLAAKAGGVDVAEARPPRPWALAVGNEGAGVRDELLEVARTRIAVPMPGGAESLNVGVAGAILLYELRRERVE